MLRDCGRKGRVGSEGGGATWWKLVWGRDTSYGLEENWKMDKVFHFGLIVGLVVIGCGIGGGGSHFHGKKLSRN
ncbi:transmembrane protein, putative [Medicago truncatula]|uniref:Transmembrane protein, putative n=1 Tax=Medicago truncatula TaxID=3880 RepID=A0A072U104_MEDTR|nr:transmembrane protein, putative [Medicago truncatula]